MPTFQRNIHLLAVVFNSLSKMKYMMFCVFCMCGGGHLFAQVSDSSKSLQLTVQEDMLNLKSRGLKKEQIYSASKTLENFINAPVSVTVITQKMIEQTGVNSIAEALRLAPGLWVQQKTNGNYEVHIRHSFSSSNNLLQDAKNQQLLVVIDHAPQYDYLFGGILWEALPVDIQDIERIEVIRTPSVVFFGNAAINGVIHIFTKQTQDNDLQLSLNSQSGTALSNPGASGSDLSAIHRGALSFGLSDKLQFRFSGNYYFLNRFQDSYFLLTENRYLPSDSLLFFKQDAPQTNLNTKLGRESLGLNAFTTYTLSKKVLFTTQLSYQNSHAQTIHTDDTLALTQRKSALYGINLNGYVYNFHLNASHYRGERNYALGYIGNDFQLEHTQASLNYLFQKKAWQLQSGFGFLHTSNASITLADAAALSANRLVGYHAFAKANLTPLSKWRLMASVRGDKYEQGSPVYLSYQISSSVKIKNHLIRGSYTYNEGIPLVRQHQQRVIHMLLPGLMPNKTQTSELGWRARILSKINVSMEVFYSQLAFNQTYIPVASPPSNAGKLLQSFVQVGASARGQVWFNKLQIGGFVTVQRLGNDLAQLQSDSLKSTPQFYGGLHLNYMGFLNKLNANIQLYFYDQAQLNTKYGSIDIPARSLINFRVSYKVWREHLVFFNARNALNTQQREYAFADSISGMYLLGFKIKI